MNLKTIDQIASELTQKVAAWKAQMKALGIPEDEVNITGMELLPGGITEQGIQDVETELHLSLPDGFRQFIKKYQFCGIELCDVAFGSGEDLSEFFMVQKEGRFWERWQRDDHWLLLGSTESFAVVLDCSSAFVIGIPVESDGKSTEIVATSFEAFMQALGTVFLEAPSVCTASELSAAIGCQSDSVFWAETLTSASKKKRR